MKEKRSFEERKASFNNIVFQKLTTSEFKTRSQLVNETGLSDSKVRSLVHDTEIYYGVISYSSRKGYKLVDMNATDLQAEYEMIKHSVAEDNSRIKALKERMRSKIACMKILQKKIKGEIE